MFIVHEMPTVNSTLKPVEFFVMDTGQQSLECLLSVPLWKMISDP